MNIAVISASTFAACTPYDEQCRAFYGSEMSNAVLVEALVKLGHKVTFYAPTGSTPVGTTNVTIRNTFGEHLGDDEVLDNCSFGKAKYQDLLSYDFVLDMSKEGRNIELLKLYHSYDNYISYRSGFQDYLYPVRLDNRDRHYVTHCKYFADLFKQAGHNADVAFFGIPDWWGEPAGPHFQYFGLASKQYLLFPHRPVAEKGIDILLKLAKEFPSETFVIQTSTPLPDHKASMGRVKELRRELDLHNLQIIDIPQIPTYHYYRRELYRNAKAVLCPFHYLPGYAYHDTGGLVGAEAIKTGTPLIVTRSPGSEEWWGDQDGTGVVFVDGYDSCKMALKYVDFEKLTPKCPYTTANFANDYMTIINKYL